ncbi:alpha-L-rhamnosidase C-terminal domain-containing protein [Puia sp. P3]|uniref:alpha-L-rhamnosidase C-terminal domain-containing protein n=1 Tax=Puia sp. P3 TaxID=3423952 RepID=UPI003D666520
MLHDYWMYRGDDDFIRDKLNGARDILKFFSGYQGSDGSLKNTPYWTFVDWANGKDWSVGSPPKGADGGSAILDLQLLWAYQWAGEMEGRLGLPYFAGLYHQKAEQLKQVIRRKYWSASRRLFADTEEKTLFSQHANSLAILTGLVASADLAKAGQRLLTDSTLTQCSIYFKYYLHQALTKAGLGDGYMDWLGIWRKDMAMGLTTWAEDSNVEYTRSDCHAWSSSPNIEFFRTVLGIDSDAPGFKKIKIEPHLGKLTNAAGEIPHPRGKVGVRYRLDQGKWRISISLPAGTTGRLVWKGKDYELKAGDQLVAL